MAYDTAYTNLNIVMNLKFVAQVDHIIVNNIIIYN